MKKHLTGKVKSDKMTNTAVVVVERFKVHPKYLKRVKVRKSYKAENTINAKIGDRVRIEETKPLSKDKSWQIVKII